MSIRKHERFRREALDVHVDVPISFAKAALGGDILVPTLEGDLPLTLRPGTQTGSMYRMRGKGMPAVRGGARGDHMVSVHVAVPTKLNKRERELLEEFAKVSDEPEEDRSFFERVKEAFKAE